MHLINTYNTRLIAMRGAGSLYVDEDHTVQLNDTPELSSRISSSFKNSC